MPEEPKLNPENTKLPDNAEEIDVSALFDEITDTTIAKVKETSREITIPTLKQPNSLRNIKAGGQEISKIVKKQLKIANTVIPEANFTELTETELTKVIYFIENKLPTYDYKKAFHEIKFMILRAQYGSVAGETYDKIQRMRTRIKNDDNYVPNEDLFNQILPFIIKGSESFFKNNVNLLKGKENKGQPHLIPYKNPLKTLLTLRMIKENIHNLRSIEAAKEVKPVFSKFNHFHACLLFLLEKHNSSLKDLFGNSETKLIRAIRTFRSIGFNVLTTSKKVKQYKDPMPVLTPAQHEAMGAILNQYKDLLEKALHFNKNEALKVDILALLNQIETKIVIPVKETNAETAMIHVLSFFDTRTEQGSKSHHIKNKKWLESPVEIINRLSFPKMTEAQRYKYRNDIYEIECQMYINKYFAETNPEKRQQIQKEGIKAVKGNGQTKREIFDNVLGEFYNILELHIQQNEQN